VAAHAVAPGVALDEDNNRAYVCLSRNNAVAIVEAAADNGAKTLLMPVTSRKQLVELDDDLATRVTVVYYGDPRDALFKALLE